ncbi:hypothetical protein [Spongiactinospora sp. TRM90649]|uniref:hypothetical protein n=1 Tax=Spongiactinospora sp. TRM90649 TaxID=3031114 RepID=UPI0023F7FDC3|nr:hypothetical protein [Spongiactinospora sp. TRM90649]MDF5753386.1 hypothetical protein [Spongiactinospora sp. TRM90649]
MTSADGEPRVFSVLLNQYLSGAPKDLEDAIAVRLAMFSRTTPTDLPAAPARRLDDKTGDLECSWVKPVRC